MHQKKMRSVCSSRQQHFVAALQVDGHPRRGKDLFLRVRLSPSHGSMDGEETELVANFTGQPPQLANICDKRNEKLEQPRRRTVPVKQNERASDPGTKIMMKMEMATTSKASQPSKFFVLQSDQGLLDETVESAFHSESSEEFFEKLPEGRMKDKILSLTGRLQPVRKRTNLDHIQGTELVFEVMPRKSLDGVRKISDVLQIERIDPSSLVMRNDYDEKIYTGSQNPSFSVFARDVHDIGNGLVFVGPSYKWPHQYVRDISSTDFQRLYYDQPLPNLLHDGTKLGDILNIHVSAESAPISVQNRSIKPLIICTGFSPTEHADVAKAGLGDVPIHTSYGISFRFDQWHHETREIVSGFGNPSLQVIHGFVTAIADDDRDDGALLLTVRVVLAKDNLPPQLSMPRLPEDAVFQTNLQVVIPAKCVVSAFQIKPLVLHTLAGSGPANHGLQPARPIEHAVYVAGHLDFELGDFQGEKKPPDSFSANDIRTRWLNRYEDQSTKALALLHDFCARGGIPTGEYAAHHAPWKEKYKDVVAGNVGGCYNPKATVCSIAPFPTEAALRTIHGAERLLVFPHYGPYISELRSAIRSFALAKTKRAKQFSRGKARLVLNPNIPGRMLMQLVHEFVVRYTPLFREGAVEAVVDEFQLTEQLTGSRDGIFNLGECGIVELRAPLTFRLVLYDPKRSAEDSVTGVDGRAEVVFAAYAAKDRHGADLTGDLYDEDVGERHKGDDTTPWSLVKLRSKGT